MSSSVFGAVSTAGALQKLLDHTGEAGFVAVNDEQRELLTLLPDYLAALPALGEYVTSMVADTAEEVNDWLAKNGFPDLRLVPWSPSPCAFGVAAVSDVLLTWMHRPGLAQISTDLTTGVVYPAVSFSAHQGCDVLTSPTGQPVVVIRSREGLQARIMISDRPETLTELLREGRNLLQAQDAAPEHYASAVVPMIHLDVKPDLTWLIGLRTSSPATSWEIEQAVQQVKFGLNRTGARLREASAMAVRLGGARTRETVYRVDRPFLLTISKDDLDIPIFTAWVDIDSWADPGDLSSL